MSNLDQNSLSFMSIGRDHWDVPVRVELRPYLEFTRRINVQLRQLVDRWENKSRYTLSRLHRPKHPR